MFFFALQKYNVSGIPAAIVLRASDGALVTSEGREKVQGTGPKAVDDWLAF